MYTFDLNKFISDGKAITKDGELEVSKFYVMSTGLINVTLKYKYQDAGIISRIYNQYGEWVDIFGRRQEFHSANRLLNV